MRHNHITRDIKPRGNCPACDLYHEGQPKKLTQVVLVFPEGIGMREAQAIAQEAEKITKFGISSGGYKMLTNIYMMSDDEPIEFDESTAEFIHSYRRES